MRVLFLTHYYPPELGAAPARIAALAEGLSARGLRVTVHTGVPSYPSGAIASPYRNRPWQTEHRNGVRVLRSVILPAPNRGFARRLANHTVFAVGAVGTSWRSEPQDVVVAETPPLFTAAAGVAYARARGARLALNVSDLWPESAIELGALRAGPAAGAAHALARWCYRHAALITAPTEGIVDDLRQRAECAGKVVHVAPAVDLARFAAIPELDAREGTRRGAPLRVLYAGTLGLAQGLDTLLDAAAIAGPATVELLIAGDGPAREALRAAIDARGLDHVRLLGDVASERIPLLYGSVDAGIVPLLDRPIFAGALPTKLFEVMAAGRPTILAARGESARLVQAAGAGVVVTPEQPRELAAAFTRLRDAPRGALEMGRRGRLHAAGFDRGLAVDRWHELLGSLAGSPRA